MKRILFFVATAALLAGCSNGETPVQIDEKVDLKIASLSSSELVSRAAFANQTEVTIMAATPGAGLYTTSKSGRYTYDKWDAAGTLNPESPYSWGAKTADDKIFLTPIPATLIAFTPADMMVRTGGSPNIMSSPGELLKDWETNYNSTTNPDLCVARKDNVTSAGNGLTFSLAHINSLLEFRFTKDANFTINPGKITNISLQGAGLVTEKIYKITTAEWQSEGTGIESIISVPITNVDASFTTTTIADHSAVAKVLVPPAILTPGTNYILEVTMDNIVYRTTIPYMIDRFDRFDPNGRYIIEIKFTGVGIGLTSVSRQVWTPVEVNAGNPLKPEMVN